MSNCGGGGLGLQTSLRQYQNIVSSGALTTTPPCCRRGSAWISGRQREAIKKDRLVSSRLCEPCIRRADVSLPLSVAALPAKATPRPDQVAEGDSKRARDECPDQAPRDGPTEPQGPWPDQATEDRHYMKLALNQARQVLHLLDG
jgi:hypothetical protein